MIFALQLSKNIHTNTHTYNSSKYQFNNNNVLMVSQFQRTQPDAGLVWADASWVPQEARQDRAHQATKYAFFLLPSGVCE